VKLKRWVVIFAINLCAAVEAKSAIYDSEKLGESAGAYIEAISNYERISQSKCAYAVEEKENVKIHSISDAVSHVMPHLRSHDREEMRNWLAEEGDSAIAKTGALVGGYIERRLDDGLDIVTTCELVVTRALKIIRDSREIWFDTVWSYGRSDLWCKATDRYSGRLDGRMHEDSDPNLLLRTFRLDYETGVMDGVVGNEDYQKSLVLKNSREEFDVGMYGAFSVYDIYNTQGVSDLRLNIGWTNGYDISFTYYESVGGMSAGVCLPIAQDECLNSMDCVTLVE